MASSFVPVAEADSSDESFQPVSEAPEKIGGLESFGRGAAQAFSLGYSPQMIAAIKTGNLPFSDNPEYAQELAKQKAATSQAWEQHPWLYGTGMVASAIPAAASAVFSAPEVAAASTAGLGARLLAGGSNLGSLGGAGLRAAAGKGAGLAPSALRGAATIAENPLLQGAVFGSSEGETLGDKLSGAAAGAVGAKVAPMVLGAAGNVIKSVGSKIAPEITDPLFSILTGNPNRAENAQSVAHDLGISFPGAAISKSLIQSMGSKADFLNQVPQAANETLGKIGGIVSDFSGNLDRKDTGAAIRNAVGSWIKDYQNPTGFVSQLNDIYAPVKYLSNSTQTFSPSNLQSAVSNAWRSSLGKVTDLSPTLKIAQEALSHDEGLTFDQLHAFRQVLDDHITYNKVPGTDNLNSKILIQLRNAVSNDMNKAANAIGGSNAAQDLAAVNKKAADLYSLRDSVLKTVGNPNTAGSGAKPDDAIYRNIIGAASKQGGGNISDLENLQKIVGAYNPEAWSAVGKTYASNIAPEGQFTYNNFNKLYNGQLHPDGRDLIFGKVGTGGVRDTFEKINKFGKFDANGMPLGQKLDALAANANKGPSGQQIGSGALSGLIEAGVMGGLPLKTMTAAGLGSVAGRFGARDVAAPLASRAPTPGEAIAAQTIQKAAPAVGAQMATESPLPGAIKAGVPYVVKKITDQLPTSIWNAPRSNSSDVRYGRKSGGRVSDKLVAAADRAKKSINSNTESLLNVPDTHVAQALELANKYL